MYLNTKYNVGDLISIAKSFRKTFPQMGIVIDKSRVQRNPSDLTIYNVIYLQVDQAFIHLNDYECEEVI